MSLKNPPFYCVLADECEITGLRNRMTHRDAICSMLKVILKKHSLPPKLESTISQKFNQVRLTAADKHSKKKEHVVTKMKLLLSDDESPLSEKSASSTEHFLSFATNNTTIKPNAVDYFLADKVVSMEMLNRTHKFHISLYEKHFREERRLNAISFSRCNVRGGAKDPFDLSSRSGHPEELLCYQSQQRESMGVYFPITQGTKAQVRRTIIVRRAMIVRLQSLQTTRKDLDLI
ncbi:hypothetical protein OUZ56_021842 [Daphnia magna]|uniref:Uncharacterized protein n=1 Tax=Daphnia magna TaxID=35525 RepID=A0ABR0AUL5_9CRUS|nr:hypothetical protein OUZ56_021842 [Daphnia magna]